jgi:hypothetical protein
MLEHQSRTICGRSRSGEGRGGGGDESLSRGKGVSVGDPSGREASMRGADPLRRVIVRLIADERAEAGADWQQLTTEARAEPAALREASMRSICSIETCVFVCVCVCVCVRVCVCACACDLADRRGHREPAASALARRDGGRAPNVSLELGELGLA